MASTYNTNVIVKVPNEYDAVVLDSNNKIKFITRESYVDASLSGYTKVGPVINRDGNIIDIAYYQNASRAWSIAYSYRLTGYTLDGTDRTGVLSIRPNSSASVNTDYTVSYNATDVSTFISQLNTYFKATSPFTDQDWSAVLNGTDVDLVYHYTFWQQASYNTGKSGFTLTANLLPEIPYIAKVLRYNGNRDGEGVISNMDRALTYFRNDNSSTTYNPSSDVTDPASRAYPICLPGYLGTSTYQSDHCAALRAIYGEGEDGWKKFMNSLLPVVPSEYGSMDTSTYGDTLKNSYILASKTFTYQDGSVGALSPAAQYCTNIGFSNDLLAQGKWGLPDLKTLQKITSVLKYGTNSSRTADPLNEILYKMDGSAISNGSYPWSSSRYDTVGAWISHGYLGFFVRSYLYGNYVCVPVLRLRLDEIE